MKRLFTAGFSVLFLSTASFAAEMQKEDTFKLPGTFSGNLAVVSDYTYRGITQNAENPALQGGVNYLLNAGAVDIYAGAWGSNVNFKNDGGANLEADWLAGIRKTIDKLSFDVGVVYYTYPGAASSFNYNYTEGALSAEYDFGIMALNASVNYSPEYSGKTGKATYYKTGFMVPTPLKVTFDGHVGRQTVENNVGFGYPDYTDWALGAAYSFNGFDFKVEYMDTNISKESCADGCDAKAVITISHSF